MSFTDVVYGGLGQANNANQANLAQNAAAMQQQQNYYNQQAALGAQSQAQLNNLYGPQGFGGQTAYYAGQGADYGRATGGYGGYGGMNDPFSPVGGYNSLDAQFDHAAAQQYLGEYPDIQKYAIEHSLDPEWFANQHANSQGGSEGRNTFGLTSPYSGGGFNTYGYPSSGLVGSQSNAFQFQAPSAAQQKYLDAYPDIRDYATSHGLDPGAFATRHATTQGNNEGRNTFGLTNANPNFQQGGGFGMGSAFDPSTYGGSTGNPAFSFDQRYPAGGAGGSPGFGNTPQQPMASDNMYNQQQMIQDLYKTLGITENALGGAQYPPPFVNLPGG